VGRRLAVLNCDERNKVMAIGPQNTLKEILIRVATLEKAVVEMKQDLTARIALHGDRLQGAVHALAEGLGTFVGQVEETQERLDKVELRLDRLEGVVGT
jgi:hypothetical protein